MRLPIFEAQIKDVELVSTNRKFLTSPKYLHTKEHVRELFRMIWGESDPYPEPVAVELLIRTKKDIDNCDKLIHDALEGAGVIKNDSQIVVKSTVLCRPGKGEKERFILRMFSADIQDRAEVCSELDSIPDFRYW